MVLFVTFWFLAIMPVIFADVKNTSRPETQYCHQYLDCLTSFQEKAMACLRIAEQDITGKAANSKANKCQTELQQLRLEGNRAELKRLKEHMSCITTRAVDPPMNFNVVQAQACANQSNSTNHLHLIQGTNNATMECHQEARDVNQACTDYKKCCTADPYCVLQYELSTTHDTIKRGRLTVLEKQYSCNLERHNKKKGAK